MHFIDYLPTIGLNNSMFIMTLIHSQNKNIKNLLEKKKGYTNFSMLQKAYDL